MAGPGETDGEPPDREPELYRDLVEESADIVAVLDPDGTVTYASRAVERVLGHDPAAVVGTDGEDYVHPEHREAVRGALEAATAAPQTVEARVRRADGSWCWLEGTLRTRRTGGEADGVVVTARDVTERRARNRDLRAANERMELALEGANLGIWDWDMETDEVSRDERLTAMLGYTQSEMGDTLRGWERAVHPEERDRHDEALAEHVQNRTPYYQCDHRLKTKAGEWKWVRTTGRVVERDADGTPVRAVGIHQDIDDRKERKRELRERERKYRNLFEDTRDALMVFDRDGYLDCNEQTLELFGIESVEAFLEYTPWELSPPRQPDGRDSKEAALERIQTAFAEGEAFFEWTHQRVDGTAFPAEVKLSRFEYEGEPVLHALIRDITDRKAQERRLQEREAKYRNLFEDTRDALMLLDRDGFFDCNERTLELFGIDSVAEFVQYAPWDVSPPEQPDGTDSREAALARVETAFEEGEAFFEWTHRRADGTAFPAEVKLSRFEYDGEPALHAMVRDITERKEYQQRLEEQRDNLDVLNQVLRHDIRNDIQLITAYAELLEADCEDEEVREYVETILDNARHAVDLTVSAREMADVMLSAEEELADVDLRQVLETELEEVRSAHDEAVVRAESVPSATVRANDLLGSVFRNLLTNAIQHNDAAVPAVTVSGEDREESVLLRFADNGPGVPDDQKAAIFGKGEKGLDSGGTGIGLYLVRTLLESYGGAVRVEDRSDPDATDPSGRDGEPGGAVFVVELPKAGGE